MESQAMTCRLCSANLLTPPLLRYPGSPRSAQGFFEQPPMQDDSVCLDIYQCSGCGLVQHVLPAVPYYREVIRSVAFSKEMGHFRISQLGEWIQSNKLEGTRILEVGCGRGEYMELLKRAGASLVTGIEYSAESVDFAKKRGLDVYRGYLDDAFDPENLGRFGAFAVFSFMEHWPDINGSLKQLDELLEEGAQGLVEVPNLEHMIQNGLYSEFTTDHIYYFDRATLARTMELNGFEVHQIQSIWHDYILSARVSKRGRLNTDHFVKRQQEVVAQIQSFVDDFAYKDVVIWGAGHQALAIMSIAQLGGKVSHVIDSATFKQGRYTPGTGLLIKSPASLLEDRPRAVLIMAAAYSEEVAHELEVRYPQVEKVAILKETGLIICK